nr:MAG: coat protein [Leviviridae sp.]
MPVINTLTLPNFGGTQTGGASKPLTPSVREGDKITFIDAAVGVVPALNPRVAIKKSANTKTGRFFTDTTVYVPNYDLTAAEIAAGVEVKFTQVTIRVTSDSTLPQAQRDYAKNLAIALHYNADTAGVAYGINTFY